MNSLMRKGRASGGPRNRIMLEAPVTWDGMVRQPALGCNIRWYPGRYIWSEQTQRWEWKEQDVETPPSIRPSVKFIGF